MDEIENQKAELLTRVRELVSLYNERHPTLVDLSATTIGGAIAVKNRRMYNAE